MRVASFVEDVQSTQDKRSALYQSFDDAIDKFKGGKDQQAFVSSRKKIDADYKQLTQHMQHLQAQLKTEGSELAEKVRFYLLYPLFLLTCKKYRKSSSTSSGIDICSGIGVSKMLKFDVTQKCLRIGTPKINHFPFVSNGKLMVFRCPNIRTHYNEAVLCLNFGTPENNKFSIWDKWKIYYF